MKLKSSNNFNVWTEEKAQAPHFYDIITCEFDIHGCKQKRNKGENA